ncbi:hypothetical protein D3C75_960210 [compost metagenome]
MNWRVYSTKAIITPTVTRPRIASRPPTPATIAKLRLLSPFINLGIKPEIDCAQYPDSIIRPFRSRKPVITRSSWEKALIIRCPDKVSSMNPLSSPRLRCRSLNSGPVRRVIQRMPSVISGTTMNVSSVSSGLSHSITPTVPSRVRILEKI